mgnify:CR=1 FL=1
MVLLFFVETSNTNWWEYDGMIIVRRLAVLIMLYSVINNKLFVVKETVNPFIDLFGRLGN